MLSFVQKISIVILLLAMLGGSIFFSLQSDFLLTCLTVQELVGEGNGTSFNYFEQKKFDRIYGKLTPVEQKFVTGMHRDNPTEWAREIYESDPENILYVSLYAAAFAADNRAARRDCRSRCGR